MPHIRLAHALTWPPFAYVADGKSLGTGVEVARAVLARIGYTYTFVPVAFDEQMATVLAGHADGMLPFGRNLEREKLFDFSEPLIHSGGALYVRAPAPTPQGLAEMAGKTVVSPKTGPLVAYIRNSYSAVTVVPAADYEESLKLLVEGKADAAALNDVVGGALAARLYPGKVTPAARRFLEIPLCIAVAKGKCQAFIDDFDRGLAELRADGGWDVLNQGA